MKQVYVGYWNNERNQYPEFPMPVVGDKKDSTENIAKVKRIIAKAHPMYCKGWSNCRCCGKSNGTIEYRFQTKKAQYYIPEGYIHYLEEHNIQVDPVLLEINI